MKSYRRTNKVGGFVNFPIDSPDYINDKQGGMFVQLWVREKSFRAWGYCCGYSSTICTTFCASLIGTDKKRNNEKIINGEQHFPLEEELFPHKSTGDFSSIPLLACITLGTTGWSGVDKNHNMWCCIYNDLTDDGKQVYDNIKKLYKNKADLMLITWLDT